MPLNPPQSPPAATARCPARRLCRGSTADHRWPQQGAKRAKGNRSDRPQIRTDRGRSEAAPRSFLPICGDLRATPLCRFPRIPRIPRFSSDDCSRGSTADHANHAEGHAQHAQSSPTASPLPYSAYSAYSAVPFFDFPVNPCSAGTHANRCTPSVTGPESSTSGSCGQQAKFGPCRSNPTPLPSRTLAVLPQRP